VGRVIHSLLITRRMWGGHSLPPGLLLLFTKTIAVEALRVCLLRMNKFGVEISRSKQRTGVSVPHLVWPGVFGLVDTDFAAAGEG
jgi:hypothetical protein